MREYNVIILAAGIGKRMQAGRNKQFIMLNEKALLSHTLTIFEQDPHCVSIYLLIRVEEQMQVERLLAEETWSKPIHLVYGGEERQDSVYNGLKAIQDPNKLVFIHDGARPFVSQSDLDRLNEVVTNDGAGLLVVPVKDTIKRKQGDHVETLDRSLLYAAQTPQGFDYELILNAHQAAKASGYYGTDDASLVERMGGRVQFVQGHYHNIKITTPEDLEHAQFILNQTNKE
ncbi:2-C-methyl-D-erythritol 4-phosphate cytidylyltransferase [Amphibacillus cookii]|uniref:2-C-methyl-D-erythritol 4-phosphate cytidylyltransferase n=1 Tax=Amphibacillus cookii TaxID=767787 RepID=UPI00195E84A6|nr:2-C-methyl-D-erythritol 4-phosphate cytidylyltransferase [Amphibacillus cookii]MBM7542882.1 2-C-methyl-D-erythritol 4-phosphate cytidylyltransferase [Amphibacillus cookii]